MNNYPDEDDPPMRGTYPPLDLTGLMDLNQVPDNYMHIIADTYNNMVSNNEDGEAPKMPKWMRGYMVLAMEDYFYCVSTQPPSTVVHRLVVLGIAIASAAKENGWSLTE